MRPFESRLVAPAMRRPVGDGEAPGARRRRQLRLLLADVVMPGIDGVELAKRVRRGSPAFASCHHGFAAGPCRTKVQAEEPADSGQAVPSAHLISEIEALLRITGKRAADIKPPSPRMAKR